jgi:hypothetical protein
MAARPKPKPPAARSWAVPRASRPRPPWPRSPASRRRKKKRGDQQPRRLGSPTTSAAPNNLGGALAFAGQTTRDIASNASPADVKSALEALSTIGEVLVWRRSLLGSPRFGYEWTVVFQTELGKATSRPW